MLTWNQTKELLSNYTDHTFGPTSVEANLTMVGFQNANLQGAYLAGVKLQNANLQDADLRYVNLAGAKLQGANLTGADLYRANLVGANLVGADLTGADLVGADLHGANLEGTGIITFNGSKHFAFYVPWQQYIKIGGVGGSVLGWLRTYKMVGAEYGYTPEQIAEYLGFVQMCANKVGA